MSSSLLHQVKRKSSRSGSAMLEFALGSSILIAAFTGTFQFGYTFLQYNTLMNAVSRGARYASLAPYDSLTTTPSVAFQSYVNNMVLYGSPSTGTTPVFSDLSTANITLTVAFKNGVPGSVTVAITGYTINSIFATFTLTNKPQITYTYQGIWTPS